MNQGLGIVVIVFAVLSIGGILPSTADGAPFADAQDQATAESEDSRLSSALREVLELQHESERHFVQGRYRVAIRLMTRSCTTLELELGAASAPHRLCLRTLARIYVARKQYREAVSLIKTALSNTPKPPTDPLETGFVVVDLAESAVQRWGEGDRVRAKKTLDRVLANHRKVVGERRHRPIGDVFAVFAEPIFELAESHRKQGHYEDAVSLLRRLLQAKQSQRPTDYNGTLSILDSLHKVYLRLGRQRTALETRRYIVETEHLRLRNAFVLGDDPRLLGSVTQLIGTTHESVSGHFDVDPGDVSAADLALETVLNRKSLIVELVAQSYAETRISLPSATRELLGRLPDIREKYVDTMAAFNSGVISEEEAAQRVRAIDREESNVWRRLRAATSTAAALRPPVTVSEVQHALPESSALVEYVQYSPPRDAPSRYVAYVLQPDQFSWVDLGPATQIDASVLSLRGSLAVQRHDVIHRAGVVHELIMAPVLEHAGSARRLFIAPDGELNVIPFGALHDGDGFLIESHMLHYLTSGRDLLRPWKGESSGNNTVLAIANPTGSDLPGTDAEATLLQEIFPHTISLLRDSATDTQIKAHGRPWILHIATHGFFEPWRRGIDIGAEPTERTRSFPRTPEEVAPEQAGNPMLRSGLLFAAREDGARDASAKASARGRVTAYEISSWDLHGTELVVLSACDTGLGEIRVGQSVFGLRRGFAMAGAQTQVVSLWKISDETTPMLVRSYYGHLAAGLGRGEAMHRAQLELLGNEFTQHPYYWAGFIVIGDWTPLSTDKIPPSPEEVQPISPVAPSRGCRADITGTKGDIGSFIVMFICTWCLTRPRGRTQPFTGS